MTDEIHVDWHLPPELLERVQAAAATEQVSIIDWIIAACEARLTPKNPALPLDRIASPDYESIRAILDKRFPKNRVSQAELDRWLMMYLAVLDFYAQQPPE